MRQVIVCICAFIVGLGNFSACETSLFAKLNVFEWYFPEYISMGKFSSKNFNNRGKLHQVSMIRLFFFLLIYSKFLLKQKQNKAAFRNKLGPAAAPLVMLYCLNIIYGIRLLSHISINYPMNDAELSDIPYEWDWHCILDLGILAKAGKRNGSKESPTNVLLKQKQWPVRVYTEFLFILLICIGFPLFYTFVNANPNKEKKGRKRNFLILVVVVSLWIIHSNRNIEHHAAVNSGKSPRATENSSVIS